MNGSWSLPHLAHTLLVLLVRPDAPYYLTVRHSLTYGGTSADSLRRRRTSS